jgi:hypothetical protein
MFQQDAFVGRDGKLTGWAICVPFHVEEGHDTG